MDAAAEASGEISTVQIEANGFTFDTRVAGPERGEAVMLLHGFPQTSFEWRSQLAALGEAGFRAIAPNQRGYSPGARPPDVADYAVPLLVQDALAIADALGVDRFHVVGHDWGAAVAWGTAGLARDRVRTLTAISVPHPDAFKRVLSDMSSCQYQASFYFEIFSAPGAEDAMLANGAAQLRGLLTGVPAEAVEDYVTTLGTPAALGAALNWYRANIDGRVPNAPELGAISVPTLFVWSDADIALCRDGAELTGDYVDAPYRFEVLAGVSHWVPDVAPDALNELLVPHVQATR